MINKNFNKLMNKKSKIKKARYIFIITFFTILLLSIFLYINISPIIHTSIVTHGNLAVHDIVSGSIERVLENNKEELKNILTIEYSNDDVIKGIHINSLLLNKIKNESTKSLVSTFNKGEPYKYKIALNTLLSAEYLIPSNVYCTLFVNPFTSIDVKINSVFEEAGINQTKIKVTINLSCDVNLSVFAYKDNIKVSNEFILAEQIIVGDVPNLFNTK